MVPQPLLPDVQVGKTPPESLGEWCWIPQLPQRCFCLLIFVVGWGGAEIEGRHVTQYNVDLDVYNFSNSTVFYVQLYSKY